MKKSKMGGGAAHFALFHTKNWSVQPLERGKRPQPVGYLGEAGGGDRGHYLLGGLVYGVDSSSGTLALSLTMMPSFA